MSDNRIGWEAELVANVKNRRNKKKIPSNNIKSTGRTIFFEPISYGGWRPQVLGEVKTHIYYR